jgi:PAS domain S-box-containing protein
MVTSASKGLALPLDIAAVGADSLAIPTTNNLFAPSTRSPRRSNPTPGQHHPQKDEHHTFDEVGELADEFNNMLTRLAEFEKSTVGSLMEEKDKSVAILRSISEPLIILDADFKVELLNERYEEMFGIRLEEAAGKPFTAALSSGDIIRKFNEIDYKAAEYKEAVVETKLQGENKIFNVVLTPMRYSTTGLPAMIVIFHDITELKTLEKMRSDFIATISHEFKTPLTSVLMGIDLMENSALGKLNTVQKEILQTIQEDSQRLSNLVNDLLELSRIESTAMIYNFVPCDINTIIKVSAKQVGPMAKKTLGGLWVVLGADARVRGDFLKCHGL